jgi:hypothetical protein
MKPQPEDNPREFAGLRSVPPSDSLRERVLKTAHHEWAPPAVIPLFPAPLRAFAAAVAAVLLAILSNFASDRALAPWRQGTTPGVVLMASAPASSAGYRWLPCQTRAMLEEPAESPGFQPGLIRPQGRWSRRSTLTPIV